MERRLSAILAADMVGYSRLIEADEIGTLQRQKAHRTELLDPAFEQFHGRLVKEMGDGILVEFPSIVEAVKCALMIQRAIPEREAKFAEDQRVAYRIGINLGDVVVEDGDLFGDGVNVAARLEEISEPGGICISGTAFDQIEGRSEFVCEFLGDQRLKNITRPVRAYRISDEAIRASNDDRSSGYGPRRTRRSDIPSIAVLPFENLSNDPDQEFFADGMTEDVITLLSTVPDLLVIARSSIFAYKGKSPNVRTVARDLEVRYVLEGSVRRSGNRIRITAQFIDAIGGSQLWAQRYDRELIDIFHIQDEVAQGIVGALQSRLLSAEAIYLRRKPPASLDAWGNVVEARLKMFAYGREDMEAAEPFARKALAIQEDYAPAHSILGQILAWTVYVGWTKDWLGRAREALAHTKRALDIDSSNPTVLTDAVLVHANLGLHLKAAKLADRAIEAGPNGALTCGICGLAFAIVGRTDEGVELVDKSLKLSPRDPLEYFFRSFEGLVYFLAGQNDRAREALERSLNIKPELVSAHLFLAAVEAKSGSMERAKIALSKVMDLGAEQAILNLYRPRTEGTVFRRLTEPIRQIYPGELPEHPD